MTIISEQYVCNVCGETKSHAYTYGLQFTSTGRELEEHEPGHVNTHLCSRCMSAIRRMEISKSESEPEAPAEDPPSEAEGPDKPSGEKVTVAAVLKYLESQGHAFKETAYSQRTVIGLLQPLLTELAEAKRKLEAQATATQGVLNWRGARIVSIEANGRSPEACSYGLYYRSGRGEWEVWRAGARLHVGTLRECQAWCEALERNPDSIPFETAQKEDVRPKT